MFFMLLNTSCYLADENLWQKQGRTFGSERSGEVRLKDSCSVITAQDATCLRMNSTVSYRIHRMSVCLVILLEWMKLFIRLFQSWWYKLFPCFFHVFPVRILALEENFLLQFRMDVSFFFMLLFHKFCNWINNRLKSMIKSNSCLTFFPPPVSSLVHPRPAVKTRERETLRRFLTTMML